MDRHNLHPRDTAAEDHGDEKRESGSHSYLMPITARNGTWLIRLAEAFSVVEGERETIFIESSIR